MLEFNNIKIKIAKNFKERLFGLMFKKNVNYGMLFYKTNMIHTFFMRINIDIYGLDDNLIIIEKRKNIKPCSVVVLKNSKNTLEIPSSLDYEMNIGDRIKF